jgi:hypothetical protein
MTLGVRTMSKDEQASIKAKETGGDGGKQEK